MDYAKSLILLLGLCILSGCVFQPGNVKVDVKKKNSLSNSNSTPKTISSVSVINNQIKVTGTGLAGVTSLKIQNSNLNETFSIESATATQIIANASHALSIGVGQIFDLILNSAEGAATFPVSFSLDNGSITAAMLSSMSASPGQILKYNGAAWVPSSISSSQLYIGTWNANTNSPDLNLTTPQAGDYYVVTTGGTQGAVTYAIGDWIISNGTTWSKLSHSSSVVGSFNGRTGLVVPASGDYTWAQINKTSSKLEDIADIDITSRVDQKVLKWDATNSKWIMGNDNTGAGAPGPGSITTTEILDGTIANADLAGSIAQSKITNLTTDLASKLVLTSLSATSPLGYDNTTGVFSITNATIALDGAMSAADKTKLNGLETLPSADGLLERFSGVLRSSVCADGEVLKWVTLTGWTCSTDSSTDSSKQSTLTDSAGLAAALSDESGTGLAVFNTAPTITNPDIRGELRLSGATSGYVGFVSTAVAGATTYKLPATQGTAGQVLTTDGIATNATLSWVTPATSSISLVGDIGGSTGANTIGTGKVTSTHLLDGTIVDADVNAAANIAITKLGTGAVSTTEFNYLTGVTSSIQTQLAAKEATLPTGATTDYIRGDKTLSVFATDVINSVLSTYTISALAKPAIASTDTVVGAFNKVQKYINDIDGDYVSKSASTNNTVSGVVTFNTIGSLNIGYTPTNATDAVSKAYVDVLGVWAKGAGANTGDLYRLTGNVGIGTIAPQSKLQISGQDLIGDGVLIRNESSTSNAYPANIIENYNGTGLGHPFFGMRNSGGTYGLPTSLPADNVLGASVYYAHNGTQFVEGGREAFISRASPNATTVQTDYELSLSNGTSEAAAFVIKGASGNVGIGTSAPSARLDVVGNLRAGGTVLGNTFVNQLGTDKYWKIAVLPISTMATYDHLVMSFTADENWVSTGKSVYTIFLANRGGLTYRWSSNGPVRSTSGVVAYEEADGSVSIWLHQNSGFSAVTYSIHESIQVLLYPTPIAGTPSGTIVFDTIQSSIYKPYMVNDGAGNVGIGITSPTHPLNVVTALALDRFGGSSPHLVLRGASGTQASPTATASGGGMGLVSGNNFDGATWVTGASMSFATSEISTSIARGSEIHFATTPNGSITPSTRMTISHTGAVGIGTTSPTVALDVNGSISSQGPAGEATAPSFSVATGGGATVTGYTIDAAVTVGSGFNAATGLFQPTVAGRYLLTANTYSGASSGWSIAICKNAACNRGAGAIAVPGNGSIANLSRVVYLNGTTDTASAKVLNYTGGTVSGNDTNLTWTKLP